MAAALEEGPPATSQPNTSEISQPSYSVIEDSIGQLVGCTNEKVIWPNRPLYGKYSLGDELSARKKSRRRARKKAPSKRESPVPSLRCMSSTSILGPAINPGSDVYHIPSWVLCSPKNSIDDSSSFEDIALRSETSFSSITDLDASNQDVGDTYGLLGLCTRDDAVHKLKNRWNAVLFNEENNKFYLAVMLNDTKYVMSIKEISLGNDESGWGISWFGRQPGIFFRSLKKMTHFYSFNPAAAFYELTMK